MKKLRIYYIFIVCLICVALSGCATNDAGGVSVPAKDKLTIVTSFYPVYITTINVTRGIENVNVQNMTKPQTGCLHDYQLLPEDMKLLEKTDAFVVNGAGMESFMAKVLAKKKDMPIVEASKEINIIESNGESNPHVWTNVANVIIQTKNIAEQLASIDPVHADAYRKNASLYIEKLEKLSKEMHVALDDLPNKNIVTFHEAFPYFAREFNFTIVSTIVKEPGIEPSPKDLEECIGKVKASQVKGLFVEPQYSETAATVIAKETGVKIYTLDPIVTGEADEKHDDYIYRMKKNMDVLRQALK